MFNSAASRSLGQDGPSNWIKLDCHSFQWLVDQDSYPAHWWFQSVSNITISFHIFLAMAVTAVSLPPGFNEPDIHHQAAMNPWHAAAIWPEVERVARNYGVQTLVSVLANDVLFSKIWINWINYISHIYISYIYIYISHIYIYISYIYTSYIYIIYIYIIYSLIYQLYNYIRIILITRYLHYGWKQTNEKINDLVFGAHLRFGILDCRREKLERNHPPWKISSKDCEYILCLVDDIYDMLEMLKSYEGYTT